MSYEEIAVHGTTDRIRIRIAPGRNGNTDLRGLPQDGNIGRDILQLEK